MKNQRIGKFSRFGQDLETPDLFGDDEIKSTPPSTEEHKQVPERKKPAAKPQVAEPSVEGHKRTMSSQLAARKGSDKKYATALLERCRSFGFTAEQVQSFEHPRVVFEIDSQDYSSEHFDKYNQSD